MYLISYFRFGYLKFIIFYAITLCGVKAFLLGEHQVFVFPQTYVKLSKQFINNLVWRNLDITGI